MDNKLIDELLKFDNVHYLTKVSYDIYDMNTKDLVNFLFIHGSTDFSFWGNYKWTIDANGKKLDGGIALLEDRHKIVTGIAKIVNEKMNGNFYEYIYSMMK